MKTTTTDAKRAAKKPVRSARHAVVSTRRKAVRKAAQARDVSDELIDAGRSAAEAAHRQLEAWPHVATLAALAAGVLVGALVLPRR